MVALLIGLSVMSIMLTVAMPVWKTAAQREREAELIFRGQQYARAIDLYQRKLPGSAPPSLDVLLDQKFLRKKYKDPITGGDFEVLSPNSPGVGVEGIVLPGRGNQGRAGNQGPAGNQGSATARGRSAAPAPVNQAARGGPGGSATFGLQAGVVGVVSKSKAQSIRLYNGRNHYNEWQFVHVPRTQAPGAGTPEGGPGSRGGRGGRGGSGLGPGQPGVGPAGRGGRGVPPPFPPAGPMPNQPGRGPGVQPVPR
jgi:type II secretory pathway pseudopilin PulG